MNLTIYIDILFLINLITDYIILNSTALLSGRKANTKRVLFASCIGATYSVIIFFPSLKILNVIFLKFLVSILIIFAAFKFENLIGHLKILLIYYITNAIYGGGTYIFYSYTAIGSKMNFSNGVYYISLPLWCIIIIAFLFYFLIKVFSRLSDSRFTVRSINKIEIHLFESRIEINALIDTGNALYDPISLLPILLLEVSALKNKISSGLYNELLKNESSSLEAIHKAYPELRFRIVPFKDVSGKMATIFAFKPQKVFNVDTKSEISNVLVGLINTKLSADNSYNALLHSTHKR